jgi:hypothetical protein
LARGDLDSVQRHEERGFASEVQRAPRKWNLVQNLSLVTTNEVKTNAIQLAATAIKPPHIALFGIGFNAKGRLSATVATQAQGIANHQRHAKGSRKKSPTVSGVDENRLAAPNMR